MEYSIKLLESNSVINQTTLFWMKQVTSSLRVNSDISKLMSAWRNRKAKRWDKGDEIEEEGSYINQIFIY